MAELVKRIGVVKAVQGHLAVVMTRMEPECESCSSKEACFSLGGGDVNTEVKARNTAGAEVGDLVTISIRGSSVIKVSFLVYMVPILALIGGVVLGHYLSAFIPINENILVGVLGLFAFCGAFIWLRKKGDRLAEKHEFMPEVTSKKKTSQQMPPSDLACPVE